MKYRKIPIIIEAHQWFKNGDHPKDRVGCVDVCLISGKEYEIVEGRLVRFYRTPDMDGQDTCKKCGDIMHYHGWIDTSKNGHIVCPGDFIIKDIEGGYYPCKSDIFKQTYEEVK